MDHDQYDAMADWMQAHRWVGTLNIYVGSYALSFAVIYGLAVDSMAFALLAVTAACVWVWRIGDHGFMRGLDRKYPSVALLECMADDPIVAATRAVEGEFWRGIR